MTGEDPRPEGFGGLDIGSEFAGFRIEAILGRGGMGIVYEVRDLTLDAPRALKVLEPRLGADEAFRERFRRESRLAAAIDHPAVVTVHRAGEEDGLLFIAMRLVRGPDLHRVVAAEGPLAPDRAARIVVPMASALDAAHELGIVHRDVKPANVLVEPGEGTERPYLTDFGIGRPAQAPSALTSTGELLGTADYISPEQVEGEHADAASDVYALGCTVFYLLTAEAPFDRDTQLATLYAHAHAERPRPSVLEPGVPQAVDDVIARATAVDPGERYATAGELADDLVAAVDGSKPTVRRSIQSGGESSGRGRGRLAALAVGAAAIVAAIAATVLILGGGDDDGAAPGQPPGVAVETFGVDHAVDSLVVGRVNVLAAAASDSALVAIDPDSGHLEREQEVDGASAVDVGFNSVWVSAADDDAVLRFGPPDRHTPTVIDVGDGPADIAVDRRWVWVANSGDETVSRIDPSTNEVAETTGVPGAPEAITAAEGGAWVALPDAGAISRVDRGGTRSETVRIDGRPVDLVADPSSSSLWVLDQQQAELLELDQADGTRLNSPWQLGGEPDALDLGLGAIWVADPAADTIAEVDPHTGEVAEPIRVGKGPTAVSAGDTTVWVASRGARTVTRVEPQP